MKAFPPKKSSAKPKTLEPSHDAIAVRAYHLWEDRGRIDGQADENWLDAERELRAAPPPDAFAGTGDYDDRGAGSDASSERG
ncbi:MAG TPA: DUF2934 domain-containing protein [Candidatus Didemnitutus sp.]|nr:DUF2934 domain-containing protein [Candidatus Didemnitutus sp.]